MSFEGWKAYKLKEIAKAEWGFVDGPFGSNLPASDYTTSGIPIIRGINLSLGVERFKDEGFIFVSEKTASRLQRSKCFKGDIIFTKKGTLGQIGIIPENSKYEVYLLSSNQMKLSVNPELADKYFVYYYLASKKAIEKIRRDSEHTGVPKINLTYLKEFPIHLPNLKVQREVASILSHLDEKIELNRQTNQTLEAIGQALFKEWFVEFKFPGASGDLEESKLAKIPKGWRVVSFEEVLDADRGLSYKGAGLAGSDAMPMHNLNSIYEGGGYKFEGIKYYTGDFKGKHIVKPGDLIIANTEQGHNYLLIGYPAIVPSLFGGEGIYSHHIYRLKAKQDSYLTSEYLYQLLLQPEIREQVIGFANGTTVNMLKIEGLQKPRFALPPKELVLQYSKIASSFRQMQEENIKLNQTLTELRNTLLPKLMKGEIPINETPKFAAAV